MKVALVQFNIAWEDKAANHRRVESMLEDAAIAPGTFVLLPELADTGFSLNVDEIVDETSAAWAAELAESRGLWVQHGYPEHGPDGKGRNCAAIFSPHGDAAGVYRKVHPFSYGREGERYGGGTTLVVRRCGESLLCPIVCPIICYDLRFPELFRLGARAGAEVFAVGANWPSARQHHWRSLLIARAIENQAYVAAVNRVGSDPHLHFAGGSMVVDPRGEVIAEAGDEETVLTATLDLEAARAWRREFPALRDIHDGLLGTIEVDAGLPVS